MCPVAPTRGYPAQGAEKRRVRGPERVGVHVVVVHTRVAAVGRGRREEKNVHVSGKRAPNSPFQVEENKGRTGAAQERFFINPSPHPYVGGTGINPTLY